MTLQTSRSILGLFVGLHLYCCISNPLKTSENQKVFWHFQGGIKIERLAIIELRWVKNPVFLQILWCGPGRNLDQFMHDDNSNNSNNNNNNNIVIIIIIII